MSRRKGLSCVASRSAVSCALLILALVAVVSGDSPKSLGIRTPGYMLPLGYSSVRRFRHFSYGVESLQSPSPAPGGDVLRSSIYQVDNARFSRPATPSGHAQPPMVHATPRTAYPEPTVTLPDLDLVVVSPRQSAAQVYRKAVGIPPAIDPGRALASLAPPGQDAYSSFMRQGETFFRAGRYEEAMTAFEQAHYYAMDQPEVQLALFHAAFAQSPFSYDLAARYLRRAIDSLPELPLAPLRPRSFYGDPSAYDQQVAQLARNVEARPDDANAQLVLAYFRWFEGDATAANRALQAAAIAWADRPELLETVQNFSEAMEIALSAEHPPGGETRPAAR